MKRKLGIEPTSEMQTEAAKALRTIISMHCAIADRDYVSQLKACVGAIELVFNTMAQSSGDVAALFDEVLPPASPSVQ